MTAEISFRKLTPILFVEAIEPCLPFWTETIGLQKTVEVAEGDALGFVILSHDEFEIMLQTRASLEKDVPAILPEGAWNRSSALYIDVADIDAVTKRVNPSDIVVPLRTTFYGAREIFVRAPGGHMVAFAQMPDS